MAVYNAAGTALASIYDKDGNSLQYAYDIDGVEIFSGETPFVPTILTYDTNWLITQAWLDNAQTQRDAVKAIYQQSADAIPFFVQTDGHGRYNEGNKGCHNLTEPVMQYIPNLMLGDYASYYGDGANPTNHTRTSAGITNYLPVMGNHEFMPSTAEGSLIADLSLLVPSYTPSNAILGSQTYGYYKVLDDEYNVKYLVGQPYVPDSSVSAGFTTKFSSEQYEWFIDEMEANDGYDIIILNHQPFPGTYYRVATDDTVTYTGVMLNLTPIVADRRAKRSGSFTDVDGVVHAYDFTNCESNLLVTLHGHIHKIQTGDVATNGFASFTGRDMTNAGDCAYGIIDREGGKLYIFPFNKTTLGTTIVLDL